jgi:hypothetical protein
MPNRDCENQPFCSLFHLKSHPFFQTGKISNKPSTWKVFTSSRLWSKINQFIAQSSSRLIFRTAEAFLSRFFVRPRGNDVTLLIPTRLSKVVFLESFSATVTAGVHSLDFVQTGTYEKVLPCLILHWYFRRYSRLSL